MNRLARIPGRMPAAIGSVVLLTFFALGFALAGSGSASASAVPTYQLSRYAGVAGTAGTPTNSEFGYLDADAVNAAGDVFVVDVTNYTVDEITPSGQITVIAGGGATVPAPGTTIAATSAHLNDPYGVAVDASGDVYIADYGNEEVEKVTPSGQLSVIAGGGGTYPVDGSTYSATDVYMYPDGVAVDAAGNVYIADWDDAYVYKVTPAGQLSIIVGNGNYAPSGNGVAIDEPLDGANGIVVDSADDVFVSEQQAGIVVEVTPAGQLTIVAGTAGTESTPTDGAATTSGLDDPWGIALDGAGDLYVADSGDGDISAVTPDGQLTVIAGTGTAGSPTYGVSATTSALGGPGNYNAFGVASTAAGRLYIGDTNNYTVDLLIPNAPVNTVAPTVSGTIAVGSMLTATRGTWTNVPILYAYQWQDCDSAGAGCTNIAGATSSTYTLTSSDQGHTVRVVVTAQNGAGSVSAVSAVTALLPAPTPTPTPSPTPSPAVPAAGTGAASSVTAVSEAVTGTVAAHSAPATYEFQYGTTTAYGQLTAAVSLPATTGQQTVQATISGLTPGTTYHYRLVVIGSNGQDTYSLDQSFTTAKVPPRVVAHIATYWQPSAPYHYLVKGRLKLHGVSAKVGFASGGRAVVTVTRAGKFLARHTVRVTRRGTYRSSFTFTAAQLPGTGRLMFHIRFLGNKQLLARPARTHRLFYGPSYKLLHQVYGFTASKGH